MKCNFDELIDRRNTDSEKWKHFDQDVIPMWVADMDFPSPEPVVQALLERVNHRVFGYPCDSEDLYQAIIAWLSRRHSWTVTREDVMLVPGVINGFNLVTHAVTEPGDAVLIQTPAYPPFFGVSKNARLIQQENELVRMVDGSYQIDFETFETTISDRTRIFMLCNPQNPTGRVFRKDELEKLAEICLQRNILICSDEIHHDLVFSESKHIPIASLDKEIANHSVTLLAPSKTFNIAGLTASVLVCTNPDLREKILEAKQGLVSWVNLMGQTAMRAAYQEGEEWLEDVLAYLQVNRDYTYDFVNKRLPGIRMAKPEGTYLAWLDCREASLEEDPADFFLNDARVGLNSGARFGQAGAGFVRLNFGCPRDLLEEGLNRMLRALEART